MRFTATYSDDALSFDADDWRDAMEQAQGHEAQEYGILIDLEREVSARDLADEIRYMEPEPTKPTMFKRAEDLGLSDCLVDGGAISGLYRVLYRRVRASLADGGYRRFDPDEMVAVRVPIYREKSYEEPRTILVAGWDCDECGEHIADIESVSYHHADTCSLYPENVQ